MGQKHIKNCLSLKTGAARDCRCADEEKHYWGLAFLSLVGFIVQIIIGFWSNSVSVLADATHQFFDGGENVTSAVVSRKARGATDENKLRKIGGLISAVLILGASFWILNETLERIESPRDILPEWMLIGGIAGLLVGVVQFIKHVGAHEEHKNLTHWWQYWHLVADISGSVAVVTGAFAHMNGYVLADTIASLFVVGIIWSRVALKFYNDATNKNGHPHVH